MPTKDRVVITANLHPVYDAELIAWVKSIPEKGRSAAIRDALRLARGLSPRPETQPAPDVETRFAEMERDFIEALQERDQRHADEMHTMRLALANGLNGMGQSKNGVAYDELDALRSDLETKLSDVERRINELALTGVLPTSTAIEITPSLDDEALAARKQKMKKASW